MRDRHSWNAAIHHLPSLVPSGPALFVPRLGVKGEQRLPLGHLGAGVALAGAGAPPGIVCIPRFLPVLSRSLPCEAARPLRSRPVVPTARTEGSPACCPFLLAGEGLALAG